MVRPSDAGVKMFTMAKYNLFTPEVKKAKAAPFCFICCCPQALGLGGMEVAGRAWQWSLMWLQVMGVVESDPLAAYERRYAGMVQSIAFCPKRRPQPSPTNGEPRQPHPPSPRDALTKAPVAILPSMDMQETKC